MSLQDFPNKKDRIIVLVFWFIVFLTSVCDGIFLCAFQNVYTITIAIIFIPLTVFAFYLVGKVSKGFYLKNIFNKKKFKSLYNETVKKFNGASVEFLEELKKRTYFQFMLTGNIYYYHRIEDETWLFSDNANMQGFILLMGLMRDCIEEKSGFNGFIDKAFNLTHNGELVNFTLDNSFLSGELRYLLLKVYEVSGFNLDDNNMSDEYSEVVNKKRQLLDKEYTPLLYNFEDEVKQIVAILNKKVEENNSIKVVV